jgi:hypothetical protein
MRVLYRSSRAWQARRVLLSPEIAGRAIDSVAREVVKSMESFIIYPASCDGNATSGNIEGMPE